jgi:5-methylcytosine-specific restriction enzyme subunit McrC
VVERAIRIKNIYYMLSYAYSTLQSTGYASVATEDFDHIHDLLAAILRRGVDHQIKRGLHRDYAVREEALASLRGQVLVAASIKQQTVPAGRLVCRYDEFTEDSELNQVVKATLLMLLRRGELRPANRQALRALVGWFDAVTDIPPAAIRWDSLRVERNNASYRMLLGVCRLAIEGLLPTTRQGHDKLTTWLNDEPMHRLYERFVLAYYQQRHPELAAKSAFVEWDLRGQAGSGSLPRMKTDITLRSGGRRLIIDTKYYSRTMQSHPLYGSLTFRSAHLYQLLAYVKNADSEATGEVAGVLLYAKTDEVTTPDGDFNVGGNWLSLKTLDLDQDWGRIVDQLERVCWWVARGSASIAA